MKDRYNRSIKHVRLSLTEHCNFRCTYCVPPEGIERAQRNEYLQDHEIVRLVRILSCMGVTKVKLTGGEPLLRNDICHIINLM